MPGIIHEAFFPTARTVVAAAFIAGLGAAFPGLADKTNAPPANAVLADVTSTTAAQSEATGHMALPDERVEDRIKDLHSRLGITTLQEDAWYKVAKVMRENASTMATLTQARSAKAPSMTAVDDIKSYGEIAEAHADGIQKFGPVFADLYNGMSDAQKANADAIFRAHAHRGMKQMSHKSS